MWRAKLQRMMDELPEKYLQAGPSDPEELALIPPGSKQVSRLTEEEIRLDGVCRQLWDMAHLEAEAHRALHGQDESKHPPEACLRHSKQMFYKEEEIQMISDALMRSLHERLGFENDYAIIGHDVYAIPSAFDEALKAIETDTEDDPATLDDAVGIWGFRGWPKRES